MRETVRSVAVAWLIGAAVCAAGLIGVQALVYVPIGLTLDFLNPILFLKLWKNLMKRN